MVRGAPGPVVTSRYAAALGDDDPVVVMAETPDLIRKLLRGLRRSSSGRDPRRASGASRRSSRTSRTAK